MKTLTGTPNAILAINNFALDYSWSNNIENATIAGLDMCDNDQDQDDFAKMIASFICGELSVPVQKINNDDTWRTESVTYNA